MKNVVVLEHDWWPCPIPEDVAVGEGSWLYSAYAFLHDHGGAVRIGRHTGVYIGTMFELGPHADVTIGDYCTLAGPIIATDGAVSIGDYSLISYQVVIADRPFAAPPSRGQHYQAHDPNPSPRDIFIDDNVWIGAKAVILGGARIGEGSVIGAAAVVDFPVEPFSIVAGDPARVVGTVRG